MNWLALVVWLLRAFGLVQAAETYEAKRQAEQTAKDVANAPTTDSEWKDAAERGDL